MRRHRLGRSRLAAWLGVIALGLNTLVPIHLVFDLADALAPAHHAAAVATSLDRHILALLSGHTADGPHSHSHHHDHHHGKEGGALGCPVCAVAATLAALAPTAVVALPVPTATAPRLDAVPIVAVPPAILTAAYRSRAPPAA